MPATYRDFKPTFPNRDDWTLPTILRRRAEQYPDKTYLDVPFEGLTLTYGETLDRAERIASGLLAAGGNPNDRVLIMAPNSSAVVLTWFGASFAEMVEVPINTGYRGSFLEHQVHTTAPRFALIDAAFAPQFVESREACRSIERIWLIGDEWEEAAAVLRKAGWTVEPFERLLDSPRRALPAISARDLASIFFTSGTTGPSKGVMMTHSHMTFFADEGISLVRLTEADTYMSVGPLFHGNAQFLATYPAMIAGGRIVLREKFSASGWASQIRDCGATVTNFVGVMMEWAWKQPPRPDDADNALRCVWAVPTATSIVDAFKERFGIEAFVENFGLTETSMPILTPYDIARPPGAAGLLVEDWFEVRIVDPKTDVEVPVGQVGELLVRPKEPWTTCLGYYGMPEKTTEAFRNLWFHTGDGLRRDEDGWYYFVDRLKDTIRRRGENISSYEVEQAVLEHPGVSDCAAIAVPAEAEAGEDELMIFVVAAKDVTRDSVSAWCKEHLPAFAEPRYMRFVAALPTTPSGKVRKVELRELALAGDISKDVVA